MVQKHTPGHPGPNLHHNDPRDSCPHQHSRNLDVPMKNKSDFGLHSALEIITSQAPNVQKSDPTTSNHLDLGQTGRLEAQPHHEALSQLECGVGGKKDPVLTFVLQG